MNQWKFPLSMFSTPNKDKLTARKITLKIQKTVFGTMQQFPQKKENGKARLPIFSVEKPLWAYANVQYKLKKQIVGAGYYYGTFKADTFNLSSLPELISPKRLKASGAAENLDPTLIIEDFQENWEKEWFTYKPHLWGIKTHKIYDPVWAAPKGAKLSFKVRSKLDNKLVVGLDSYVSEINIKGGANWNFVSLTPDDFYNFEGNHLAGWSNLKELRFEAEETLRPGKDPLQSQGKLELLGKGRSQSLRIFAGNKEKLLGGGFLFCLPFLVSTGCLLPLLRVTQVTPACNHFGVD